MKAVIKIDSSIKKPDWQKLQTRCKGTISPKEALGEVTPFQWEKDITTGAAKIEVWQPGRKNS